MLPPFVNRETRLLILGSFPGVRSLQEGAYYAHPQNRFWWLLQELTGSPLLSHAVETRPRLLLENGIGLWDVVKQADRQGSLDSSIRNAVLNDVPALVADLPLLRAIAFNGSTAWNLARKWRSGLNTKCEEGWQESDSLATLLLPSSSPANAVRKDKLLQSWKVLDAFLELPGQ